MSCPSTLPISAACGSPSQPPSSFEKAPDMKSMLSCCPTLGPAHDADSDSPISVANAADMAIAVHHLCIRHKPARALQPLSCTLMHYWACLLLLDPVEASQ